MKCYHHDDADGRGAAAIISMFEEDRNHENYIEVDYVQELPIDKISKDEKVYFVDYSFSEKTLPSLKKILEITNNVIWIDHHQSSLDLIKAHKELDDIRGIRYNGISGMALAYMYLYDKLDMREVPQYIQRVSDFDCFKFELGVDSEHFILGLQSYKYGPLDEIWRTLYLDSENGDALVESMIHTGRIIKAYNTNADADYLAKYGFEGELDGYSAIILNKRCYSAAFGDEINKHDIACCFWLVGDSYTHSVFTTKKDIDCEKLAKKFGGGGHKGAAGFTTKDIIFKIKK